MDNGIYIKKIKNDLIGLSDDATKEKVIRLTSGAKCYGVTVPKLRQLAKDYKVVFKDIGFDEILNIANVLFENECREEILFITFLMASYKKEKKTIAWNNILLWVNHIDNWETCDQLSSNIVTDIIVHNEKLIKELHKLAKSENIWKRRFSVSTMANLNHGGRQYPNETFSLCEILLKDKEIMVSKAVGWAIREISKKCPKETVTFLKNNKTNMSAKLLKESMELLTEEQKKTIIK